MTLFVIILLGFIVYLLLKVSKLEGQRRAILNSYTVLAEAAKQNKNELDIMLAFIDNVDQKMSSKDSDIMVNIICQVTRTGCLRDKQGFLVFETPEITAKNLQKLVFVKNNQE